MINVAHVSHMTSNIIRHALQLALGHDTTVATVLAKISILSIQHVTSNKTLYSET